MASRIYTRSPFIVQINETGSSTTKLELFIWNGTGSAPASPTYTLSKPVPSATNFSTFYNISSFVNEFISFDTLTTIYNTHPATNTSQWCNVIYKRYADNVLLDSISYKAFYGYGSYQDGYNPELSEIALDEGTYYYYYKFGGSLASESNIRPTSIRIESGTSWTIRYTNLLTGSTASLSLTNNTIQDVFTVNSAYYADGNKFEVLDAALAVQKTFYFRPIEECRYTPVVVDFVNKYGAWQRHHFLGASYESLEINSNEYNLLQSTLPNYNTIEGQIKQFNTNGKDSIKVNTGFVNESFSNILNEIMLSERILVDGYPAKLKTRQFEKLKQINTKMINYTLEFEYAFETINSVV